MQAWALRRPCLCGLELTTIYTPEFLNRWEHPSHYAGAEWYDHYGSGCGRHRDSDALERANFLAMLIALGFDGNENAPHWCPLDGDGEPTRVIVRENHWAVGWVEWIAIHKSDDAGLMIADEVAERLQDYPIVDETLYSEIEDEDCRETWANCYSPKERLAYLREHIGSGISGAFREFRDACRGDWYAAANLLPCPSDILY